MSEDNDENVNVHHSDENVNKLKMNDDGKFLQSRRKINLQIWLKYISLVVLVVQNAGQVLIIRYATTRKQEPFFKTVIVLLSEIFKFLAACFLLCISYGSVKSALVDLRFHFIDNFLDTLKVGVPAFIYTIQNYLLYIAIENLDSGTYMVTYQLKILTTAMFTVLMLKRRLSIVQWISLIILTGGVAIVQISAKKGVSSDRKPLTTFITDNTTLAPPFISSANEEHNSILGLTAVITACFLSGFAGIYFEKILKKSDASIWLRNVQLASLSIPIGIVITAVTNGYEILDKGFLKGFDLVVWCVICIQAIGGLVVAVVIKYADNILKAFATSFAIIVSSTVAIFLFAHYPTLAFTGGAALVISAIFLYSIFPYKPSLPDSDVTAETGNSKKIYESVVTNESAKKLSENFIEMSSPLNATDHNYSTTQTSSNNQQV